jgi:hypothetical protein
VDSEHGAVVVGIAHDQDQDRDAAVALLETQPPLKRLKVSEPRLSLDGHPTVHGNERVEGAKIARDRKRRLGCPWNARGKLSSDGFEQSDLAGVANSVARWIQAKGRAQSRR